MVFHWTGWRPARIWQGPMISSFQPTGPTATKPVEGELEIIRQLFGVKRSDDRSQPEAVTARDGAAGNSGPS